MNYYLKTAVQYLWRLRAKMGLDFPLPCFLSHGSLYLAYGDGMGFTFFFRRPFEENEWRFIRGFLKSGMVFFDIGANQGFYALLAAKMVGDSGRVFAFEPVPSQMEKLKRNIKINRLKNVATEQLAVGSESGFSDMRVCLDGDEAMSSLREPYKDASLKRKAIRVPLFSVDDYVQKINIKSIDFIKIDVEGGELDVLKGAVGAIEKIRPIFMCEIQDIRTRQWGYEASEACDFLEKYGYLWFVPDKSGFLEPVKSREEYKLKKTNLVAVPKEKINDIIKQQV